MARPPRPDKRPRIRIHVLDVRDAERRANDAIDDSLVATVKRRGERYVADGWRCVFDELERQLTLLRGKKFAVNKKRSVRIDEGFVAFLAHSVTFASATNVLDEDGRSLIEGGYFVKELSRVGCRVVMTQSEMAKAYNCSRSHVAEQLDLLRECLLIVNWGDGWWEFDARLVWRGDLKLHKAYRDVQPLQPLEIVNNAQFEALRDYELAALGADDME
jgi:hypothetical protein